MSPQRASCTSITRIRSLLIVTWTMQQRRRYSLNRQPQFRRTLLNHPIPMLGGVATLISLAIIDSRKLLFPFLFREAFVFQLSSSRSAAQRTLDASARMARRTEELLFSSSGRRGHSEPRRQGRAAWSTSADILTEHPPDIFTEQ